MKINTLRDFEWVESGQIVAGTGTPREYSIALTMSYARTLDGGFVPYKSIWSTSLCLDAMTIAKGKLIENCSHGLGEFTTEIAGATSLCPLRASIRLASDVDVRPVIARLKTEGRVKETSVVKKEERFLEFPEIQDEPIEQIVSWGGGGAPTN